MDATPHFSPAARRALARRLLRWFAAHARDLPWRGTRDLYRIWVSETMLQQTQVATVIAYYHRFLERFPTLAILAAASEHEVLRQWEGLGYYRRARQLHAAAQRIVANHAGEFPETFDDVLALPGVGRYTAGAVLSIGRDLPLPILEANTIRVFSRLTAYRGDTASNAGQKHLWATAEELLPKSHVGQFNQSLMELGAMLCTPRAPACSQCPINAHCEAYSRGLVEQIPTPKKSATLESVTEGVVVLRRSDGRVLLRLRTPGERWAGMWDFPRFPLPADAQAHSQELLLATQRITGHAAQNVEMLAEMKHGVTRFRITLHVVRARIVRFNRHALPADTEFTWLHPTELGQLALCATGRKIAKLLV